jgi:pyridoxamine 5'-phosphate oxidase
MTSELLGEALQRLQSLLERAKATDLPEPTAMTLATVAANGRPSARTVLLKELSERGLVFYTNTLSRKGRQLDGQPWASLCFFWQPLMEQVLVEGAVDSVAPEEADRYWRSRPRMSQIGAWASEQSQRMPERGMLQQRFQAFEARFEGEAVPRPPHWSGYRVLPDLIEFWSSRPGRLHERVRYTLEDGAWRRELIYP